MNTRSPCIGLAPGAFKGTLSAAEAAACMERGFRAACPGFRFVRVPMADGGDDTLGAVIAATGGRISSCLTLDPLLRRHRAPIGLTGDGRTAIVEMARASGLCLLQPCERNPWMTSTRGTGDLIRHALDLNVERIVLGVGGSATNDGGTGMARALGVRFVDRNNRPIPEGGGGLAQLARIDLSGLDTRLQRTRIEVACDVDNLLVGPQGASRCYGPQKGASPAMAEALDRNLQHLARVIRRDLDLQVLRIRGGGAAGGLAAGLVAFLGARLRPGFDLVADMVQFGKRIQGCTWVITGEGRLDGQSLRGKTPVGVARIATSLGIPTIAVCGSLGPGHERAARYGIVASFASVSEWGTPSEPAKQAPRALESCCRQVGNLLNQVFTTSGGRAPRRRRVPS
jgi:glycerate kinase